MGELKRRLPMSRAANFFQEKHDSHVMEDNRPHADTSDPVMMRIHARIGKLAKMPPGTNVVIMGETGVGKEIAAKMLHDLSKQSRGKIITVNCAALPESMFERELFGHNKGAFTDATSDEPGLFEQAHGGTIFLDEIGDLPRNLQCKLLRVVEERRVRRLGSSVSRAIDVRIIAATNVDLEKAVENGSFRQDLYYRLCGVTLVIPPLRARAVDIPALAAHLLEEERQRLEWPMRLRLAPETVTCLQVYSFPGNVRELRYGLSAAILESEDEWIRPEHLPSRMRMDAKKMPPRSELHDARTQKRLVECERIRRALEQTAGNQTRAARLLGMPLRTFVARLDRHGFARPKKSAAHIHRVGGLIKRFPGTRAIDSIETIDQLFR
jgi:two-component system, NtrC family, response regulator AtoC